MPAARKRPPPGDASAAWFEHVVDNIADGKYLADFCGRNGIPSVRTVQRAFVDNPGFAMQCALAREVSAELNERRIAQLSESAASGETAPDAARVAINGLTWLAKVRAPKVYGDKLELAGKVSIDLAETLAERKSRAT